jgi:hypothetical protein
MRGGEARTTPRHHRPTPRSGLRRHDHAPAVVFDGFAAEQSAQNAQLLVGELAAL